MIGELGEDGWIRVQWDSGSTNSYRYSSRILCDYFFIAKFHESSCLKKEILWNLVFFFGKVTKKQICFLQN